ncbi:MAG: T9SS type A sorting domain-containing protein, partial [Saprospiraceae bacterium]|nr:T9SS type A sorting domain-containing protein [Saprospiraceae bacterium]
GGMRSENNDILIARFDTDGCLIFDCKILNDVTDVLSNVEDLTLNTGISIYPNPSGTKQELNIQFNNDLHLKENLSIEIFNALGEMIHTQSLKHSYSSILPTSGTGLFFVVVKNKNKIIYCDKIIRI